MTPSSHGNFPKNHLQCNDVSTTYMSKKPKEPRFVPYEPYKAAVNPLISIKIKKRQPKCQTTTNPVISNSMKQSKGNKPKSNQMNRNDEEKACLNENVPQGDKNLFEDGDKSKIENFVEPPTIESLEKTEKLLEETNKKLAESEKQLRIQIQVKDA